MAGCTVGVLCFTNSVVAVLPDALLQRYVVIAWVIVDEALLLFVFIRVIARRCLEFVFFVVILFVRIGGFACMICFVRYYTLGLGIRDTVNLTRLLFDLRLS